MSKETQEQENQQIQFYLNSERKCPVCFTYCETDSSKSNERDSSGDVHYCPKCKWSVSEMSLLCYEKQIENK
jgi:hypothetical protein